MSQVVFLSTLCLGPIACSRASSAEAAQLVAAVDRFRTAADDQKAGALAVLSAVACSADDVCQAKNACMASATATTQSALLRQDVSDVLERVNAGSLSRDDPKAQGLAGRLRQAQEQLAAGYKALLTCDAQVQSLKRTYRLQGR